MRIGLTSGDPNGIGIETVLQVFADERMLKGLTPVLYASPDLISSNLDTIGLKDLNWGEVDSAEKAIQGQLNILNISVDSFSHLPGELTSEAGDYSYKSLEKAVDDLASSKVDILVTAPINKEAITQSGFKFPGHTEYLAHMANAEDVLMFLVAESLRIGIVTGHIALKDVAKSLNAKSIKSKLDIMHESLARDFGCPTPRIAILGLNPHAGDNGLMGDEERKIISPVVKEANASGMKVFGPYAADGFFGSGAYKNFDGVLAMYHDQGLAPFKAMSFGRGVNFTAGLPIVRTSPDHGAGFDIAGQGIASPDSMRSAIFIAQDIHKKRLEHREITANQLELAPPKRDYRDSRR